uniref:DegT/DnrJ/EryC1/StrS family aminotransferase n=1 Tax=Faecalibaculum rodentium TaxID=1702221 RepID=UPI00262D54E7
QAYAPAEQRALQQAARRYAAGLKGVVQIPAVMPGQISAWAQYTILLYDADQRRQVQQALAQNGIPSMVYYPAGLHEQPLFRDLPRPPQGYPRSEWVSQRCLSLPMDPYIREAEIDLICRVITETILGKDCEREGEDAHDRKPGV